MPPSAASLPRRAARKRTPGYARLRTRQHARSCSTTRRATSGESSPLRRSRRPMKAAAAAGERAMTSAGSGQRRCGSGLAATRERVQSTRVNGGAMTGMENVIAVDARSRALAANEAPLRAGQGGRTELEVSVSIRTILLVAGVVAVAWALTSIASVLLVLFVSLFSVAVLSPVVSAMERRLG